MARSKPKSKKPSPAAKAPAAKKAGKKSAVKAKAASPTRPKAIALPAAALTGGPVTLKEAESLVKAAAPQRAAKGAAAAVRTAATHESVAKERSRLDEQIRRENERRVREYAATMAVMDRRGVKGLATATAAAAGQPLRIFAEGDSWFDYPAFLFGGIVPRLKKRLGVPILSLAKAGDEVRNMLGVEERAILTTQLRNGSPAGGPWDVLLFSGGGNDIVGNPMALWVLDFNASVPPEKLLSTPRFTAALELVQAGYEDLVALRDALSPSTHLVFHGYDFAIPDGRGVCGYGPWMKPTFDLRRFPGEPPAAAVVKAMLLKFAAMLKTLAAAHAGVTFINTQGTLPPTTSSWHNELHPSSGGFDLIAGIFHENLKALFPGRVL